MFFKLLIIFVEKMIISINFFAEVNLIISVNHLILRHTIRKIIKFSKMPKRTWNMSNYR